MRVRPLETVDPWSRLVLGGVGILMIAGVAATILTSVSGPATDLSTPLGVVTSYVQAVEAGDADRAVPNPRDPASPSNGPNVYPTRECHPGE